MIAVIMQPTYLPWIGYFDLMDIADVFIFLDSVQFEKQSWQQRNKIKTGEGKSIWLSVPVGHNLEQKIRDVKIIPSNPWRRKHWGTIEQHYKRAPYWQQYSQDLFSLYSQDWDLLYDWNTALISFLKKHFGIKTEFMRSSQIPVSGERVELLINICHYVNADIYLSPVGSAVYIEQNNIFRSQGISLRYQKFNHPEYSQLYGPFLSHMSAIDLLFNEGASCLDIIRSGRGDYEDRDP